METQPMNGNRNKDQRGQSIILVALLFLALILFAAIAVDLTSTYFQRRVAQNAADAAALAGAQELGAYLDAHPETTTSDSQVKTWMNDLAERNGVEDTDGVLANDVNNNVVGFYLDTDGNPITDYQIGEWPGGLPSEVFGVEATTHITAPTFFGGVLGYDGYPVSAEAAVEFELSCAEDCVLPITIYEGTFGGDEPIVGQCYNFWDGGGSGNFGWLNWSHNWLKWKENPGAYDSTDFTCRDTLDVSDCDVSCLHQNLSPDYCADWVEVGDWVAGTTGVKTDGGTKHNLYRIITEEILGTIIIYDTVNDGNGCGQYFRQDSGEIGWNGGMLYHVVGFATFRFTGFSLPPGKGPYDDTTREGVLFDLKNADGSYVADPDECIHLGTPDEKANRITGILQPIDVGGTAGRCEAVGSLFAPRLTR
jgi:hypothetical protein